MSGPPPSIPGAPGARLRLGLAGRFSLLFAALLAASLLALTAYTVWAQAATIEAQVRERAGAVALVLANAASNFLHDLRVDEIEALTDEVETLENVLYAFVLDPEDTLIADADEIGDAMDIIPDRLAGEARRTGRRVIEVDDYGLHVAEPVLFGGKSLGVARIGFSLEPMRAEILRQAGQSVLLGVAALLITVAVSRVALGRAVRPLKQLAAATEALSRGRFDVAITAERADEVGALADSFNRMRADLNSTMVSRDYVSDILRSMSELLVVVGPDGRIRTVNEAVCAVLGYHEDELVGRRFATILGPAADGSARHPDLLTDLLAGRPVVRIEAGFLDQQGQAVDVLLSAAPLRGADARSLGMVCVAQDDRERKRREGYIHRLAFFDGVTGLPNRAHMLQLLSRALAGATRHERKLAVMFLDLDRFKMVNDTFGHDVGDQLLHGFAERLTGCVRREDAVASAGSGDAEPPALARLGGDEFTVLLTDLAGVGGAARVAERILAAMTVPFELGEHRVSVATSIGIALFPDDGTSADDLLKRADTAMYRAKAEGRGCFRFFEPEMDDEIRRRVELEADLRQAVAHDELVPHFQPLVALSPDGTGARLVGFEMLARWPHARRGMVPPLEFISLAEDTGLIALITERLLRRACSTAAAWPSSLTLAVNVSPVQLRDRALPSVVRRALADSGLAASRLEIELTESALLDNLDLAREVVGELKALGVRLALDDFGTGYSSLRHLQALPFDKIKVDANFVRSMVGNPESGKIVAAVIGLGHSLGLPTVAEGVEDAATAEALADMGCDIGQGWLFGRPMPETEANALATGMAPEATISPAA